MHSADHVESVGDGANGTNGSNGAPSAMPSIVHGVNGIPQTYEYPETASEEPYRVLDQYHSKPQRLRVAGVGAGASGLCLAYKMERMLEAGSWELTLFEKNQHFGGTWWVSFLANGSTSGS